MVVITVASRKGGSGKSTLTANLAAFAEKTRRCMLVDADPQASSADWIEASEEMLMMQPVPSCSPICR